jgi:hypothetical protein
LFVFFVKSADMTEKCSGGYLVARRIHRLCPTINVNAVAAPAKMKAASATSNSQVLLSMAISITCQSRGRYGVFTPSRGLFRRADKRLVLHNHHRHVRRERFASSSDRLAKLQGQLPVILSVPSRRCLGETTAFVHRCIGPDRL